MASSPAPSAYRSMSIGSASKRKTWKGKKRSDILSKIKIPSNKPKQGQTKKHTLKSFQSDSKLKLFQTDNKRKFFRSDGAKRRLSRLHSNFQQPLRRRSKWMKRRRSRRASSVEARPSFDDQDIGIAPFNVRSKSFNYGMAMSDFMLERQESAPVSSLNRKYSRDIAEPEPDRNPSIEIQKSKSEEIRNVNIDTNTTTAECTENKAARVCINSDVEDIENDAFSLSLTSSDSARRLLRSDTGSHVFFAKTCFNVSLVKQSNGLGVCVEQVRNVYGSDESDEPDTLIISEVSRGEQSPRGVYGELPLGTLNKGDHIVTINGTSVHSKTEFESALKGVNYGDCVVLGIYTDNDQNSDYLSARENSSDETALSPSSSSASSSVDGFVDMYRSLSGLYLSPSTDGTDEDDNCTSEIESKCESSTKDIENVLSRVSKALDEHFERYLENQENGEATYDMVRAEISQALGISLDSDTWRVWFRDQLDLLCNRGFYEVIGIDMQTMSPVVKKKV